jgi:hypothetical protein
VVQVDWDEAQQVVLGGHQLIAGRRTQGVAPAAAVGEGGGVEGWRGGGVMQGYARGAQYTIAHNGTQRQEGGEVVLAGDQLIAGKGTQGTAPAAAEVWKRRAKACMLRV